jgi:uncharacterized protein
VKRTTTSPDHISRRALIVALAAVPASALRRNVAAQEPGRLVLATAGQGSAFLAFGRALAATVRRHAPIEIDIRETKGSNENAELVSTGEVATACLNMGPGFDAWNGNPPFAGRPLRGMRALVPMYETPFHTIAARERGIATLSDLNGKRVGVGPSGGPGEVFFKGVAEALDIRATLATGTPAEMGAMLLAREIDAFWYGSGLPSPPFTDVANRINAVVIGFSPQEAAAFRRRFAYFAPFEIPANTYAGQTKSLASLAVWNFIVAHSAVPPDLAYALTAALIGHADEVKASFAAAASMNIANLKADTFMPFHPGAVRYYRESGATLPAELVPG